MHSTGALFAEVLTRSTPIKYKTNTLHVANPDFSSSCNTLIFLSFFYIICLQHHAKKLEVFGLPAHHGNGDRTHLAAQCKF